MLKKLEDKKLLFRTNPLGFGYEILHLVKDTTSPHARYLVPGERIFHTSSVNQLEDIYEDIKSGAMTVETLPTPFKKFEPKLLLQKGKHGDSFSLIKSEEGYKAACLEIVKWRNKEGWYTFNYEEYYKEELETLTFMNEEDIENLPLALRASAETNNQRYRQILAYQETDNKRRKMLNKALKGDGLTAIRFLKELNGDEYNEVRLEKFESIH